MAQQDSAKSEIFNKALGNIREHVDLRKKDEARETEDFVAVAGSDISFWSEQFQYLFVENFDNTHDDLVFYVRSNWATESGNDESEEEPFFVLRHGSPKAPAPGSREIQWERSFYLNLALHSYTYQLNIVIGRRPPGGQLEILSKTVRQVHPSPSKTRMDQAKGTVTELTYPYIFFPVDDFDDFFCEVVCEPGEIVCVELVAQAGQRRTAVFQGSVPYATLAQAYQNKRNGVSAWELFSKNARDTRRKEFLKMRGPRGVGQAEMAVSIVAEDRSDDGAQGGGVRGLLSSALGWSNAQPGASNRLNACLTFINMHIEPLGALLLASDPTQPLLDKDPIGKRAR